uniref:Uncharacterized protein n=1 Tax=Bacillus phage Lurz3 TaxID=1943563 RepID=A0A1Q1PVQ5_9CAUD|nr:hypothetical protein [Bacillus phage Lurz3]
MRPDDWRKKKNIVHQFETQRGQLTDDDITALEEIVTMAKQGKFVDFNFSATLNRTDNMVYVCYSDGMTIGDMSKLNTESILCIWDAVKEDKEDKQNG